MPKKIALVTHALDFVGPAAMQALIDDGYRVVAHHPSFAEAETTDEFQNQYLEAHPTAESNPANLIDLVYENFGRLDVLVSNDAHPAIHTPVDEADIADLTATIQSIMIFPFSLMQAAIPKLKEQGYGNIIMVTSCRTELPQPGGAIPDMARAGANALVKSLSIELAPFGIPVNAIAPNYFYSEAYFPKAKFIDDPAGVRFIKDAVPAGRLGKQEEMEELVRYLANMQGSFHTGTIIKFAGGWPAAAIRPE